MVVISRRTCTSRYVLSEVHYAFDYGIIIIPFRIENVTADGNLEFFLAASHWLDAYTPPLDPHLNRLSDAIRSHIALRHGAIPTIL